MKLAVQQNHLGSQILYRNPDPHKKRRHRRSIQDSAKSFFLRKNDFFGQKLFFCQKWFLRKKIFFDRKNLCPKKRLGRKLTTGGGYKDGPEIWVARPLFLYCRPSYFPPKNLSPVQFCPKKFRHKFRWKGFLAPEFFFHKSYHSEMRLVNSSYEIFSTFFSLISTSLSPWQSPALSAGDRSVTPEK